MRTLILAAWLLLLPAPAASPAAWRASVPGGEGAATRTAWRSPVPGGEVVRPFAYSAARPFAGGQHRGVTLAARPGTTVRAPCAGTTTYAGRVPQRRRGVTLRCGSLVATVLGLRATSVERGERTAPGRAIGTAAGAVHLGARRAGDRHAYLDPLALIADRPPTAAPPPGLVPPRRPRPLPAARPRPTAQPAPRHVPLPAWLGLALLAAALPTGALARRRARTRRAEATA